MKMYLALMIILFISVITPDGWYFRKMKVHNFEKWFRWISLVPGLIFLIAFLYIRFGFEYSHSYILAAGLQWIFFLFILIYLPKLLYIVFYYLNHLFNKIFGLHSRIFRQIGFAIAVLVTVIFVYGFVVTRDNFYVKTQTIEVENLPDSFDNYRIVQLSDFHLGNWNRKYKIMKHIVRLVNEQNPDVIFFTGDMVNNFEQETEGWNTYFNQLQAKQGKYAILGNHDYGDYAKWKTDAEKAGNLAGIKQNIRNLGFKLLLNEHIELIKNTDTLTLVGVENWGSHKHKMYADLNKALTGTNPKQLKILLTHDPLHWRAEVIGKKDIFLSLSGHTHAAQIGYTRGKIHVSPSAILFPEWDGLYQQNSQYLYVNRGIGYVGMPLRIGVRPEITLIILKKQSPQIHSKGK